MSKNLIVLDNHRQLRIGHIVCTVYEIHKEEMIYNGKIYGEYSVIYLNSLCYIKSLDTFGICNIALLPLSIISKFDGRSENIEKKIKEMDNIGLVDLNLIKKKCLLFEKYKEKFSKSFENKYFTMANKIKENIINCPKDNTILDSLNLKE